MKERTQIPRARRIVVKVGSSSISGDNADTIAPLVAALARAQSGGADVVLVSSGAIATGFPLLGLESVPSDLATQQAAAAVGQSMLVHYYQKAFEAHGVVAGQVLLTAGDMESSVNRANAQRTLARLLEMNVVPVINENDTVATHEIRFSDNDHLAALVCSLIDADLLVLLSDVDALYTKPPHEPGAARVDYVEYGDPLDRVTIGNMTAGGVSRGGAESKLASARLAADRGTTVLFTAATLVEKALSGDNVGTLFAPRPDNISERVLVEAP